MKYIGKYKKTVTACLVAAFVCMFGSASTHAATLNVNSTADVAADDGQCTLREAIGSINGASASGVSLGECVAGNGSSDTIVLPSGTILLAATDLPTITESAIIRGQGMAETIIDGAGQYSIFNAAGGSTDTLTVTDLKITGYDGASVVAMNQSLVTLRIDVDGTNSVPAAPVGGGIGLVLTNGASDVSLIVEDSYVHNIRTQDDQVARPVLAGIGVYGFNGTPTEVIIRRTTVSSVSGIESGTFGILVISGILDLQGVPHNYNSTIQNVTISNIESLGQNLQSSSAGGIAFSGLTTGGNSSQTVAIDSSTITDIRSENGGAGALGAQVAANTDGHVYNIDMILKNLLLANNQGSVQGTDCLFADISGDVGGLGSADISVNSDGGNLSSDSSCGTYFNHSTDRISLPNIVSTMGSLADNGGFVPTRALLDGSPALDSGVAITGLSNDARGIARPQGTAYDSGAYEREASTVSTVAATLANTGEKIVFYTVGGLMLVLMSGTALIMTRLR